MSARARETALRRTAAPKRRRHSGVTAFLLRSSVNGRLPAFLLSVGLAVLAFGFLFSGDFAVRTVVVQGNTLAYADSIVAASEALGRSIFWLDTQEVARRVASYPAVASAEVSAEFPDRVVVQLHERVPAFVWQTGDKAVLVDDQGWVIAEGYAPKLPRIVEIQGNLPVPGSQLPAQLNEAIRAIGDKLGTRLAMLEYDPTNGLMVQLADGRVAVLGSTDRIPLKLAVLQAALASPDQWSRLDVREPDRPYYQ